MSSTAPSPTHNTQNKAIERKVEISLRPNHSAFSHKKKGLSNEFSTLHLDSLAQFSSLKIIPIEELNQEQSILLPN